MRAKRTFHVQYVAFSLSFFASIPYRAKCSLRSAGRSNGRAKNLSVDYVAFPAYLDQFLVAHTSDGQYDFFYDWYV